LEYCRAELHSKKSQLFEKEAELHNIVGKLKLENEGLIKQFIWFFFKKIVFITIKNKRQYNN